jgi:alkylated DNA repair dioxygenase AlkB
MAAALPFDNDDRPAKEGRHLREALWGLHALAGKTRITTGDNVHSDVCKGIAIMIERVERMAQDVSLQEAAEMRWATRGLLTRVGMANILESRDTASLHTLEEFIPNLERRVSALPFDIIPLGVDWSDLMGNLSNDQVTSTLRDAIPFQFDTIVTRSGSTVTERRGTAWVTEEGIGALAYSGKLMSPRPIPAVVRDTMRLVESNTINDINGLYFDCALCNHYPNGEAACKFHTDPDHGSVWERLTCVVAAGDERRFAFSPIPGISTWSKWDTVTDNNAEETIPAVVHLFPGDVVKMWGACNDDFHHAVYKSEDEHVSDGYGRVSLVLKRAISRGDDKRGHGLEGEGRRSRRRSRNE